MLKELVIENVAVIEKANVQFNSGLNVLTGETGAGKSILIDSINAILGNRTTRDIVRSGADKAVIFASFDDVPIAVSASLNNQGYECDGELLLCREISAEGKSSCRINGRPATAANVRELCQSLVTIHGQHDSQELLLPERHIFILDRYAELENLLQNYQVYFEKLGVLKREIESISLDESEKRSRIELLSYQIDELEKANLKIGEDDELNTQRTLIKNSEKILSALNGVYNLINGEGEVDGALTQLYNAGEQLERVRPFFADAGISADKLNDVYYELSEVSDSISDQLNSFDFDEQTLAQIEERLDLIFKLKRKYANSIEEILQYLENAKTELQNIESSEERLAALYDEFAKIKSLAVKAADELSAARREAFKRFEQQMQDELSYLNMPNIKFVVKRQRSRELTALGLDIIEFFISANIGEEPKPLAKIASGGELSRIMLALKCVLADKDAIPTLIFDEIDTGVSGKSSQRIGAKLMQSARDHQVICVTHSAQIASYANTHLRIEKNIVNERTFTTVSVLSKDERVEELARIISGDNITPTALQNAAEMLDLATSATL